MHGSVGCVSTVLLVVLSVLPLTTTGPARGGELERTCRVAEQPAATLLFPYFEIDLADLSGITTLISIVNADTEEPTLAHAVLWTDWGIPSLTFDLFLAPGDVQTLNLRDVFATGRGPVSGPGAFVFDDCVDLITPPATAPTRLRAMHGGVSVARGCFASPRADPNLVTGYLTVDVITRCSVGITLPSQAGYFGVPGVAATENRLWGDFFLLEDGEDFAQGQTAMHLVADPDRFLLPGPTFYGKFVGWSGLDARAPLSSEWRTRYLLGGPFEGGTELLVWRDVPSASSLPLPCGASPAWFPLPMQSLVAWDENGNRRTLGTDAFPLATQRTQVATAIDPPFNFGWLDLDLDRSAGQVNQAWIMSVMSAFGRFSVGQVGIRTNDLCDLAP